MWITQYLLHKIAVCYMQRRGCRIWYDAAALEWGGERDQTHRANQRVGRLRGMQHIHTWTYPQFSKFAITRQYKRQPNHFTLFVRADKECTLCKLLLCTNWCTHFAHWELYTPQCSVHSSHWTFHTARCTWVHSAFKSRGSRGCTGSLWSMLKLQSLHPTIVLAHKKLTHYTNTQKSV